MECRLGLIAASMAETGVEAEGLSGGGERDRGSVSRRDPAGEGDAGAVAPTRTCRPAIETWVAKGKYGKLLELWVKGLSLDWRRLYGEARPRRISLPTYPFAQGAVLDRDRHRDGLSLR